MRRPFFFLYIDKEAFLLEIKREKCSTKKKGGKVDLNCECENMRPETPRIRLVIKYLH